MVTTQRGGRGGRSRRERIYVYTQKYAYSKPYFVVQQKPTQHYKVTIPQFLFFSQFLMKKKQQCCDTQGEQVEIPPELRISSFTGTSVNSEPLEETHVVSADSTATLSQGLTSSPPPPPDPPALSRKRSRESCFFSSFLFLRLGLSHLTRSTPIFLEP